MHHPTPVTTIRSTIHRVEKMRAGLSRPGDKCRETDLTCDAQLAASEEMGLDPRLLTPGEVSVALKTGVFEDEA